MDRNDFANRLKALHSIDRDELIAAGLGHMADDRNWVAFREKPAAWLLNAEEHNAMAVWALVESRFSPPKDEDTGADFEIEPAAIRTLPGHMLHSPDVLYRLSIAISAKRIADYLAVVADRAFHGPGPTS